MGLIVELNDINILIARGRWKRLLFKHATGPYRGDRHNILTSFSLLFYSLNDVPLFDGKPKEVPATR